jgi:HPt (histidine-containing phosphotransfer) domain-containing protein
MGSKATSTDPVLDLNGALARLGGDRELFADMAGCLIEDAPKLFNSLQSAITAQDASAVRMAAHALKGLLASSGGIRSVKVAQQLENAGHAGDLSQATKLMESLEAEFIQLKAFLASHLR